MNKKGVYFVLAVAFFATLGWSQATRPTIKGLKKPNPFLPANPELVDSLTTVSDQYSDMGQDSIGFKYLLQGIVENKVRGYHKDRIKVDRRYINLLRTLEANRFAQHQWQHDLHQYAVHKWPISQNFYTTGAIIYEEQGLCDSVRKYMHLALQTAIQTNNNEYPKSASIYNSMGFLYYRCNDLDSAEYFLNEGIKYLHEIKYDTAILFFIQDNLFQIRMQQGHYDRANLLAQSNLSYFKRKKIRYHTALSHFRKIQYFAVDGNVDSLHFHFDMFKSNIRNIPGRDQDLLQKFYEYIDKVGGEFMTPQELKDFRMEKLKFDEKTNQERLAKLDFVLEYMTQRMLENRIRRDRLFDMKIRKDRQRERHQNERYRAFTLIAIILLVLIVVSTVFIIRIISIKRRNENLTKQHLENEKSILELELENKNLAQIQFEQRLKLQKQESVEMALEIKRKREWFNEIKDKLNTIHSPEDASRVIKDIIPKSIVDEKQELFKERVEELNKEYFESLLHKHPELTPIEKELCGLIKLNLNTKEIASTRGVTVNAIKVARRRLRKKLGITKEVDLYEYLQEI